MDVPHGLGLFAVMAMLIFYALEKHSRWFIVAFAGACAVGSIDGYVQKAWVLASAEFLWCVLALRRWWLVRPIG